MDTANANVVRDIANATRDARAETSSSSGASGFMRAA